MLKDLLFALKVINLIRIIEIAVLGLKSGKKGDLVAFSGVRITIDGVTYEIKGIIERLD